MKNPEKTVRWEATLKKVNHHSPGGSGEEIQKHKKREGKKKRVPIQREQPEN